MSPEKQRIAIATACGWTDTQIIDGKYGQTDVPNYLGDLNAMHEVKKVLWDKGLMLEFVNRLVGIVCSAMGFRWDKLTADDHLILVANATAEQEAEAFLRTLGLWEEEANTTKSASPTSPATEESSATPTIGHEADFVTKSTPTQPND